MSTAAQPLKLAFLGLGVMGFPMAGHLARAGHQVIVYNRTRAKADAWVASYGGCSAPTPAEAAAGADFVLACVGEDKDVREVTLGASGAFGAMRKGAVFVDHTTASADVARELYEASSAQGIGFLDAPVSGGQTGAEKGALTVMVGGDAEVFARAQPVIAHYARAINHMGPVGTGQLTKMVNQICNVGILQSLAEALAFAMRAGLDLDRVIAAISKGNAQSAHMDARAHTMVQGKFDFGFAVDWMRKDLRIALGEARRNGAQLPGTALIDQFLGRVQELGGGREDVSAVIKLIAPRH